MDCALVWVWMSAYMSVCVCQCFSVSVYLCVRFLCTTCWLANRSGKATSYAGGTVGHATKWLQMEKVSEEICVILCMAIRGCIPPACGRLFGNSIMTEDCYWYTNSIIYSTSGSVSRIRGVVRTVNCTWRFPLVYINLIPRIRSYDLRTINWFYAKLSNLSVHCILHIEQHSWRLFYRKTHNSFIFYFSRTDMFVTKFHS